MQDRRTFILQAAAVGAGLSTPAFGDEQSGSLARTHSRLLRMLVLGGTGFLGPHIVNAAVQRGHKVSVFNRGKTKADLPRGVTRLVGDRNGDLDAIRRKDWDAVLDLAALVPNWVRSLGEALKGRVGHYTFISTINVYEISPGAKGSSDERSPIVSYRGSADPFSLQTPGEHYGELKAICEQEAERQFPGKALILRPCYMVGPGDQVGAFTTLAVRVERGGEMLAAGDPLVPVNIIDVRDVASWTIQLIERAQVGPFNVLGPSGPACWGALLKTLRTCTSAPLKVTWVPVSWLAAQGVTNNGSNLLFWTSGISSRGMVLSNEKARRNGLYLRPVCASVDDALGWYRATPIDDQAKLLIGDTEKTSIEETMDYERVLLSKWHEDAGDERA